MNSENATSDDLGRSRKVQSPFLMKGVQPEGLPTYEALACFGVSYDDAMAEIRKAEQKGQIKKDAEGNSLWSKEVRGQFTQLFKAPQRLILDLFYVQTNPRMFGEMETTTSEDGDPVRTE